MNDYEAASGETKDLMDWADDISFIVNGPEPEKVYRCVKLADLKMRLSDHPPQAYGYVVEYQNESRFYNSWGDIYRDNALSITEVYAQQPQARQEFILKDGVVLVSVDDLRKALSVVSVPGRKDAIPGMGEAWDEMYGGHQEAIRRLAKAAQAAINTTKENSQ